MVIRAGRLTRRFSRALALASLATTFACAPLMRTQSPNAIGVQYIAGHGGPGCEVPQGIMYDPERVCAPQLSVGSAAGIAGSYGRRLWGVTKKEGINLRLGPELVGAWISGRTVFAPQTTYPGDVSEWFAAGLLRLDVFNEGPVRRLRDEIGNRLNFSAGAGLAVSGFREGAVLIDGTSNENRQTDVVVGPVVNFGFGYWIRRDLIVRGDVYGTFAQPRLSFPWDGRASFAGIGLVKTF
jgi:hypothetical protein